jgi:hypothetical protein
LAACELSIELDRGSEQGPARFHAGEVISGRVIARTNAPVKCDGLDAKLRWFTRGEGIEEEKDLEVARLFVGEWQGAAVAYPFRFTAPSTPIAYAGKLLNVGFCVHVAADIPWDIEPTATEVVDIVHEPPPSGLEISWDESKHKQWAGGRLGCSLAMLVVGPAVAAVSITRNVLPVLGAIGLFGLVLGLSGFFMFIGRYLAERKLGQVRMELEQVTSDSAYRQAGRGDLLRVALRSRPGAEVTRVSATFEMCEQVFYGGGSGRKVDREVLFTSEAEMKLTEPGRHQGQLQLPLGIAPYSFDGESNKLIWEVRFHMETPGQPDWSETVQLQALPTSDVSV